MKTQLEISLDEAKENIELRDSLVRLQKNKDFKRIFDKELFLDFAAECVMAKGAVGTQNEHMQKTIDADIQMLGTLKSRLTTIITVGNNAEMALPDIRNNIELEINEGKE